MFTCPMHPKVNSKTPGNCPVCGMDLVREGDSDSNNYQPLIIVLSLIALVSVVGGLWQGGGIKDVMINFMAGFFLIFSGFKLLDLKGFAHSYFGYDLLASKWIGWGYIYPFVELGLGLAYLNRYHLVYANWLTILVMIIGSLGVAISLLRPHKFQCACLGTVIKLPLSWVTLAEDLVMLLMAIIMLS